MRLLVAVSFLSALRRVANYRVHATDRAIFEHHFDAVRVRGTGGQNARDDACG